MSVQSRLTSKLSTLEAARAIYFIIAGLAIRQSLGIFAHNWNQNFASSDISWWGWDERLLVGIGYLVTVIRFSHGISLLHGHEKERVENSTLPSSGRISLLALFLVLTAIFLYLMADNIVRFQVYVILTAIVLLTDLAYILASGVVRYPLIRPIRVWKETTDGYPARAALQWMSSDILLLLVCASLLLFPLLKQCPHERFFGGLLIVAGLFDYILNRALYFGSREDKRKHKFVFVCSPLSSTDAAVVKNNINRAQAYCHLLMQERATIFRKEITPYASHCFYTYFLDDSKDEDRIIGRECAVAFLHACDAIYVYVPFEQRKSPVLNAETVSSGMQHEIDEAEQLGLQIVYKDLNEALPPNWASPEWKSPSYKPKEKNSSLANDASSSGQDQPNAIRVSISIIHKDDDTAEETTYEGTKLRKRVYVCTMLRGRDFDGLPAKEKVERLEENVRRTLWRCYELAKEEPDDKTKLAPFAPQAFFPYFSNFISNGQVDEERRKEWFSRSMEILKVCDAVYIYTTDGLPQTARNISPGMKEVIERAEHLGLDIKYRKETEVPSVEEWNPALPNFESQNTPAPNKA